ncbi:cobalamin biosynthesis protein CobD [Prolixibacter bellariivorans]|uniref:Cobalamin biosynthesis protein CobD n=1 Tax=Prolixibacter bellariivorans TaxID=314319 RepID=A0A5M4B5T1_9BACT|nr:adenosylcobinamide-phosphate synthase CbiB [Prolixibacter bellariivorans]GET35226.1 cobalamin biosynthesis protein CobD [Prolixibacter bellariivorans]
MESIAYTTAIPILGYLLDLLLGDPRWFPHPIRGFGYLIARGEHSLNRGKNRIVTGAFLTLVLVPGTWFLFSIAGSVLYQLSPVIAVIWSVVFFWLGLANQSLISESRAVIDALEKQGTEAGRKQLSYIVGRETNELSPSQIRTAVLETMSENLSDGVVAPLFWYAIGGIPLMFAYKMVNTLDSMIGYKSERYYLFGRFAARLDDIANYLPARLTALIMTMVSFSFRGLRYAVRYGRRHSSPNAGWPEATLAGILDCRFGGPNRYHGQWVDKPYIGENSREITNNDFSRAKTINHSVTFAVLLGVILAGII